MRLSVLTFLKTSLFVVLTTFSVHASFNDGSNINNASVDSEGEVPIFQEGFESTAIASFEATPDSIIEGESTTISWTTINATSCTPSGDVEGWNDAIIGVPAGQLPITILTAGTYSLTLTCDNGIEKTISVTVAVPTVITSFEATPDSIIEGESTTISWTTNAASCTPSGDSEEWNTSSIETPSGQLPLTISTAGTYSLTLTCDNGIENQDSKTIAVTVAQAITITSFEATPDSLFEGESTTISWTTNAANCTPSGDSEEWNTSSIETPSGQLPLTISTAGTYSLTLTCDDGINYQDSKTISVTVAVPTAITSFEATPGSVIVDESTTISWATNAANCTPSGDSEEWNNSIIETPSGQLPLTISTAGTYSLNLTCDNGIENQDSKNISVTVSDPLDCTSTLGSGAEVLWSQIFRLDWPGPKSEQVRISVPRYSYTSLEFYTGQIEDTGVLYNIESAGTEGSRLGAISKCPGDFNVAPECRYLTHTLIGTGILWATTGADGYCQLEKDTTYYWNTTFTDGVNRTSTECVGTFCFTTLRNWNSDYVE